MRSSSPWIGFVALAVLAGCSSGGGSKGNVKINLAVRGPGLPFAAVADACGNSLTSAQLVVRNVELEGTEGATGGDELEAGPYLIDITQADFNGVLVQGLLSAQVPDGTYNGVKFEIRRIDTGDAQDASATSADPGLQAMAAAGDSVKITGVGSAGSFTFESGLDAEQESSSDVVVGNGGTTVDGVTLSIDPSGWFVDAGNGGACLDPNDPASQSTIEGNIKSSIQLFEDDNHDGTDDASETASPTPSATP